MYVGSTVRASKRRKLSKPWSIAYGMKSCLTNSCIKVGKRLIFQGIEFLVTGFSSEKGKEIEGLICKYGGMVLWDIPSPPKSRGKRSSRSICRHFPVILCLKKVCFLWLRHFLLYLLILFPLPLWDSLYLWVGAPKAGPLCTLLTWCEPFSSLVLRSNQLFCSSFLVFYFLFLFFIFYCGWRCTTQTDTSVSNI